jgi:hypothetical protein
MTDEEAVLAAINELISLRLEVKTLTKERNDLQDKCNNFAEKFHAAITKAEKYRPVAFSTIDICNLERIGQHDLAGYLRRNDGKIYFLEEGLTNRLDDNRSFTGAWRSEK